MAIKVNNKDIQKIMCPAVNGTRKEAQAVRRYNGKSWVDVWTNVKIMSILSGKVTEGWCSLSADKRKIQYHKMMDGANNGTLLGGGTITFYLDGLWTNPNIYFSWFGSYMYQQTNGGAWYVSSAGTISLYYRKSGSTSGTTELVVNRVGDPQTAVDSPEDDYGEVEKTLTGTYDQLGICIKVHGYSGTKYSSYLTVLVEEVTFDGQKIGFPDSVVYDES